MKFFHGVSTICKNPSNKRLIRFFSTLLPQFLTDTVTELLTVTDSLTVPDTDSLMVTESPPPQSHTDTVTVTVLLTEDLPVTESPLLQLLTDMVMVTTSAMLVWPTIKLFP